MEDKVQRRIVAINTVTLYCGVEEGTLYCYVKHGQPTRANSYTVKTRETVAPALDIELHQAMSLTKIEKCSTRCFLYLGNPHLAIRQRLALYTTPGSLSRYFVRKYISKLREGDSIDCNDCKVTLTAWPLVIHTEKFHGTVL